MSRVVIAALLVGFTAACDQVLVRQPAAADLAGVYALTPEAREFLIERKGYPASVADARIAVSAGGQVVISHLPDCAVDGFGEPHGAFLNGRGTWTLEKEFLGYGLTLEIAPGETLSAGFYQGWIAIRRRSPPYELELTIGDPDSGERLRYRR